MALVGTERKPVPVDVAAATTAALGDEPPAVAPELSVLIAAGVLASFRRAGWSPVRHDGRPEPAPGDDRSVASPKAVQLLELLLGGQVSVYGGVGFLVAEWLDRCTASGRRLPPHLIPRLLATATGEQSLRATTVAAGGPRLRWVAGRNPDWAWAATPAAPAASAGDVESAREAWTTGTLEARLAVLTGLRGTNPAAARALVDETWSGENAKDRARIVATHAVGLGNGDESFLEAALDDRSAAVRAQAVELLARLPDSRFGSRMVERLRPLVAVGGRLRKKLEIVLPDEPDASARRDGIVDDGAPPQTGPKAWWLTQIVAATPLGCWERQLGLDADAVAKLAEGTDVARGLVAAAVRQGDRRWAAALLAVQPTPALLGVLPPDALDPVIGPVLAASKDTQVAGALASTPGPWSPHTSQTAILRLRACKTGGPLQASIPTLAARLHPSSGALVEAWAADLQDDDHARRHVRGLAHALSIRTTIAQELP